MDLMIHTAEFLISLVIMSISWKTRDYPSSLRTIYQLLIIKDGDRNLRLPEITGKLYEYNPKFRESLHSLC